MKVAVITDIHANLPALEAVLEASERARVDEVWSLGDVVGYGAFPAECTALVAERCRLRLLGNHDLAVLGEIDIASFSHGAAEAVRWTIDNVGAETVEALRGLEPSAIREGIGLFHASPRDPIWEYVIDVETAEDCLDQQPGPIAMIGHSHIALYFHRTDELARVIGSTAPGGTVESLSRGHWLINPGSVGQPRDNDPRAAWLEFDTETLEATYHRETYEVERAIAAITEAGLPAQLGERLLTGH